LGATVTAPRENSQLISSLGLKLAWVEYGEIAAEPLIGLHGWLDNAATFSSVAKYLSSHRFCSLDLPGHGLSDHLPLAATYSMLEYASYVAEFADQMGFQKFSLIGHSMGACIASLIAGALPQRIASLILIEGLGPLTRGEEDSVGHFGRCLGRRRRKLNTRKPQYESIAAAAVARSQTSQIDLASAEILCGRGLEAKNDGYTWRSDPRLLQESVMRLTETQVSAFLKKIECPTLLISGDMGYEHGVHGYGHRVDLVSKLQHERIPGFHHLHLDNSQLVGKAIRCFLDAKD
jgi:pimeloyl-ACP methyl ester carboxylesterase